MSGKKPANYYVNGNSLLSHWFISPSVHLSLDARKKTRQLLFLHRSLPCSSPARGRYPLLSHWSISASVHLSLYARKNPANYYGNGNSLLSHWFISASVHLSLDPRKKTCQLLSLHRSLPCSSPAKSKLKFPPLSLVHFRHCPPFIGCQKKTRQLSLSLHRSLPCSPPARGRYPPLSLVHFRQCRPFIGCPEKKPANYYPYIARFLAPQQREVDTLLSHWFFAASVHLSLDARKKTRQLLSLHRSLPCSSPARGKLKFTTTI